MASTIYLKGKISKNGDKILLADGEILANVLEPFRDKELELVITEFKRTRSNQQNRYYWGIVIPTIIAWHKETQGKTPTPEQIHLFNLTKIAGHKIIQTNILGEDVFTLEKASSSKMKVGEFESFLLDISDYFGELGCEIPEPNGDSLINDYLKTRGK